MHKPESVLENETHKNSQGCVNATDRLIPARRPDQVFISHTHTHFAVPAEHRVNKKKKK